MTFSLEGINPTEVVDVFSGEEHTLVADGTLVVMIGHFNQGYLVLELK